MDTKSIEKLANEMNHSLSLLQTEFRDKGKSALMNVCGEFFKQVPEVAALTWTQYTPYFNDGDTCEFSVREVEYLPIGSEDGDFEYVGYKLQQEKPELYSALKAVSSVLHTAEDALRAVFGDHVRVIVPRDGLPQVRDYDHD